MNRWVHLANHVTKKGVKMNAYKNFGQQVLDFIGGFFDLLGDHVPEWNAKIGKVILAIVDIVPSGLFLTWVISKVSPIEFRTAGYVIAWGLPMGIYFIVFKLFENNDGTFEAKHWFGWTINVLDALTLDGAAAFPLFGVTQILNGGWTGFKEALGAMPFIGWVVYILLVILSLLAEWYRRKVDEKAYSYASSAYQPYVAERSATDHVRQPVAQPSAVYQPIGFDQSGPPYQGEVPSGWHLDKNGRLARNQ